MKHSAYDIWIDGRVVEHPMEIREGVKNNFGRMFINVKGEFRSSDIGWQQCWSNHIGTGAPCLVQDVHKGIKKVLKRALREKKIFSQENPTQQWVPLIQRGGLLLWMVGIENPTLHSQDIPHVKIFIERTVVSRLDGFNFCWRYTSHNGNSRKIKDELKSAYPHYLFQWLNVSSTLPVSVLNSRERWFASSLSFVLSFFPFF